MPGIRSCGGRFPAVVYDSRYGHFCTHVVLLLLSLVVLDRSCQPECVVDVNVVLAGKLRAEKRYGVRICVDCGFVYACMYVCIYVCIRTVVCICAYTCKFMHTYTQTHKE